MLKTQLIYTYKKNIEKKQWLMWFIYPILSIICYSLKQNITLPFCSLNLLHIYGMINVDYVFLLPSEFQARQARNKRCWVCVSPCSVSASWSGSGYSFTHSKFLAHCLIEGKGCAPFGRARPVWESTLLLRGRAPFGRACSTLTNGWERVRPIWKGAHLSEGRAPFGRACSQCHIENLTFWFSIQCPDGVVQVVSTRGVAVSITGCRLETGVSQIFFYRQPSRQASTPCPHPHTETAELSDAVSSTARKIQELK